MKGNKAMKKIFRKILGAFLSMLMILSAFVMPAYAINSVMDIPVKTGCYMTLETNKHSLEYMQGDEVVMTVRLHDPEGRQISAPYIRYNLRVDGSNEAGYGEYQLNWTTVPFSEGEYTIKTKAIDIPGFMRLRVDILDENKTVIKRSYNGSEGDWSAFGPSGQLSFFQGGIVVDVQNIRTTAAERAGEQVGELEGVTYDAYGVPSDFMSFWEDSLSELDGAENAPKLIELAPIPLETYSNWYRYNHDLYSFKISCPGDVTDLKSGETYVTGTIQIPKDADLASAPIEMWYCGYGITRPYPQSSETSKGKITVTVAAHSLDYDFENKSIQPTEEDFNLPSYYSEAEYGSNYYGFYSEENKDRDSVYFKYMLLRDIQAIRFMTKAFKEGGNVEFDPSADEETKTLASEKLTPGLWDGENITSNGSSQGAFQAVAVAALYSETVGVSEQRITELWAGIPWMCDVQGNTDGKKVQSTYRPVYINDEDGAEVVGLNYYDTASFGRFVTCDTVISAGMGDPLCPASGISALYNGIRTNGSDVNISLGFTQGKTHSTNDNSDRHAEERIYTYKTAERVIGYTDPQGNFEAGISGDVLSVYSLGDDRILTSTAGDAFVQYLASYGSAVKTVKLIGKFRELGDTQYIFDSLDSAVELLIDYRTNTIGSYNTSSYPGSFIGMASLATLGHVEFDGNGNIVADSRNNSYESGVCDLRGFDYVINHGGDGYDTLPRCILRGTGVRKVIMPDSLLCDGVEVAGRLPVNGVASCASLKEIVVPAGVAVSEMGQYFLWSSKKVETVRFEGGVTPDFSIVGKSTDRYPTNAGVSGAVIYCPSAADVETVRAALAASEIGESSIRAELSETNGTSFEIANGVLTVPFSGDSGIAACDALWLGCMEGVTEIFIGDGYSYLGAEIFNMTTVKRVHIPASVTNISELCFGGASDFTVIGIPGSYAEKFAEEKGLTFEKEAAFTNAITADGFCVRLGGYTGLRGLFTFSESAASGNEALGYTLKEYGALACSAVKYSAYGYDPRAIYDASVSDTYLKKVVVFGEGGVNRFVDVEKKQFCISLTGITPENYLSGVYMCGYQLWTDGENEYFFATEYQPESGEEHYTTDLYGLTLFGFKNGLVNSETMEDVCLWDVLSSEAVSLSEFNTSSYTFGDAEYPMTAHKGYTLREDGSFVFKNIPLLDYTGSAEDQIGWSFAPTGLEKQSSTGIEWSLIPDGSSYVAVFRRSKGLDGDFKAILPRQTNNEHSGYYFAQLPISEAWGCLTSAIDGEYTVNSPRLPSAEAAKIRTVILDYGINGHEAAGLAHLGNVETVVYPRDYTVISPYCFYNSRKLRNIIWANDSVPHMKDVEGIGESEGLFDMRGMSDMRTTRFFYNCTSGVNVALSTLGEGKIDALFMGMSSLKRAWMENSSENSGVEKAPEEYVIDMRRAVNVTKLESGAFEMGSTPRSIYLPATITSIAEKGTSYGYNMTFGKGYAHSIYIESELFKETLGKYRAYVSSTFSGTGAATLDSLTVNGVPISQYLAG